MKTLATLLFAIAISFISNAQEGGYWSNNRIMKSGYFVDGNLGVSNYTFSRDDQSYFDYGNGQWVEEGRNKYTMNGYGVGIVAGGKIYIGGNDQRRFGVNMFGRFNIHMMEEDFLYTDVLFAPVNLGFTSIWKISETSAVEANLNTGFGAQTITHHGGAIIINPEVKFRLKKSSFGLGYTMHLPYKADHKITNVKIHSLNLIIGIN